MMMDISNKIVREIPLAHLWTNEKELGAKRQETLAPPQVKELLRNGPVQFVIADVGAKLDWLSLEDCFNFFKSVKDHVIEDPNMILLSKFEDDYAYLASKWELENHPPIVLLEKYH